MRGNTYYNCYSFPSFFKFIYITFGEYSLRNLKLWIKYQKIIIRSTLRIKYLKFCIRSNIIPQHFYYLKAHNINFNHYTSIQKYKCLINTHAFKILRMEFNDAFRTLHSSRAQIFYLARKLSQCIPVNISNLFLKKQEQSLYHLFQKKRMRIDKKIEHLRNKDIKESVMAIKKINYYYSVTNNNYITKMSNNEQQCSSNRSLVSPKGNEGPIEVSLDPENYLNFDKKCSLDTINNKWFVTFLIVIFLKTNGSLPFSL